MINIETISKLYYEKYNIRIHKFTELTSGWSNDYKLHLYTNQGDFLLRISEYSNKQETIKKYEYSKTLYNDKIKMSKSLCIDSLDHKYILWLLSWIPGNELRQVIDTFSYSEQYCIGYKAGSNLKILHENQSEIKNISWSSLYGEKIKKKIDRYLRCGDKYDNDEVVLDYIYNHINLLDDRPIIIQHGDYHDGNIVINLNKQIGIIDYNRIDIGDPWQEFDKTIWSLKYSLGFTQGIVDGYFDNNIPEKFFQLLALYVSVLQISNLPWAIKYNQRNQVQICKEQTKKLIFWYDNYNTVIPKWFMEGR